VRIEPVGNGGGSGSGTIGSGSGSGSGTIGSGSGSGSGADDGSGGGTIGSGPGDETDKIGPIGSIDPIGDGPIADETHTGDVGLGYAINESDASYPQPEIEEPVEESPTTKFIEIIGSFFEESVGSGSKN
jgi:hypothetical protein